MRGWWCISFSRICEFANSFWIFYEFIVCKVAASRSWEILTKKFEFWLLHFAVMFEDAVVWATGEMCTSLFTDWCEHWIQLFARPLLCTESERKSIHASNWLCFYPTRNRIQRNNKQSIFRESFTDSNMCFKWLPLPPPSSPPQIWRRALTHSFAHA